MSNRTFRFVATRLAGVAFLLLLSGCGEPRYPVRGVISYPDGSPVRGGQVIFQPKDSTGVSAVSDIGPDGRFELFVMSPGDGVTPGVYQVAILSLAGPDQSAVAEQFNNFATSGLEFEVKPQPNEFQLTVKRPNAEEVRLLSTKGQN